MLMVFTCSKCNTRDVKSFSKQSYESGVVLVRCQGCKNLHLIADHLGWFDDKPFMLHEHVDSTGQRVQYVRPDGGSSSSSLSVHAADVLGRSQQGQPQQRQPPSHEQAASQQASGPDPATAPPLGLAARTALAAEGAAAAEGGVFQLHDAAEAAALMAGKNSGGR